jgi:glutamate-1-semialdehyde 2,1-aminomutase
MKIVAIVQARMASTRLPGKVMRPICGVPMIGLLLTRLHRAGHLDQIVLATSTDPGNRTLVEYVRSLGHDIFQGSERDVLDRYYRAALAANADVIVRVTGDCPLIDPSIVDAVIGEFEMEGVDYACNTLPPTYPDGLDVAVFSMDSLTSAWRDATLPHDREHVTPYIRRSEEFRVSNVANDEDLSMLRWTVDMPEDLEVITNVFEYFDPQRDFSWHDVLQLRNERPEYFMANQGLNRNEGATRGTGQKLWQRAKGVIPGGNMLLSKRAEMFLPEQWPAYFSQARGCRVWDLDGTPYIDMSIMGIGTNILGYGHPEVDDAVREVVAKGNMSTLNCPEEVLLAERLVGLHPWADMVRLARTGGEANAIAIRIARAASGRDKVAVCGYHGWHDWYLSANLGDERNLDGHLLPGLEPNGVPRRLQGTALPFRYNRIGELEALITENPDLGVIMMEPARGEAPRDGFLQQVRRLATDHGIVLVFDECSAGFRETFGGLHQKYGVEPDLAMFGKALGNGYAIAAVIGRRAVMEAAQSTFISSTFWTERIGPAAALATLDVMERVRSWEKVTEIGGDIMAGWQALADKHGLSINISGLPALASFRFASPNTMEYQTLITQEMLRRGILAGTRCYACIEHDQPVLDAYWSALERIFELIRECEDGRDVLSLLQGPVCHSGFSRLN